MQPVIVALVFCCYSIAVAENRTMWMDGAVKGAVIPVVLEGSSKPSAIVRVNRIFKDYQRKGFFRIGLLPTMVAEEVRIELLDLAQIARTLHSLDKQFKASQGNRILEWRKVTFMLKDEPSPLLRAGRVKLADNNRWRLLDGVESKIAPFSCESAILELAGKDAGRVSSTAGSAPAACNLFTIASNSIPKTLNVK